MSGDAPDIAGPLVLSAEERLALIRLLRHTIEDRFPLSPRHAVLQAILAKLDPQPSRPELPSPPKAYDAPSATRPRRR